MPGVRAASPWSECVRGARTGVFTFFAFVVDRCAGAGSVIENVAFVLPRTASYAETDNVVKP